MKHQLKINNLGPIQDCELIIDRFTVLTGPQANGKSTVAKAIYFFRSVKQDILQIARQGGPKAFIGKQNCTWSYALEQRMKDKFLQLFGTSWVMPLDMELSYTYQSNVFIRVSLQDDPAGTGRNYIHLEFSKRILEHLSELENFNFTNVTPGQLAHEERSLNKLFNDTQETVFIPAGRNLITLLSTQLNYIFTSLDGPQLRNIDYVTKKYIETILRVRPMFQYGIDGIIRNSENDPIQMTKYQKNRASINLLWDISREVLGGEYRSFDDEERLYLPNGRYVKINLASSGQQEVIWIFNLLFYYLWEDKDIFLILEEPESHLYPASQELIARALSLMLDAGSSVLVTTHSPYLLGTFNYLLLASQTPKPELVKKRLRKRFWLPKESTEAFFIQDGHLRSATTEEDGLKLVQNELIDGASLTINEMTDAFLDLFSTEEGPYEP